MLQKENNVHPGGTAPEGNVIRVLIADDHFLVRTGLVSLISRDELMKVVGEATNGQEAVKLFREHCPDVVLMDLRMPVMDGLGAIGAIRALNVAARILVLTSFDGDEYIYRSLQAGARGYCLKDASADDLYEAIITVSAG